MADILTCPTCGGTSKPYDPSRYAALETRINALAGIPDPSAYVARHEAMREALEEASEWYRRAYESRHQYQYGDCPAWVRKARAALADEEE